MQNEAKKVAQLKQNLRQMQIKVDTELNGCKKIIKQMEKTAKEKDEYIKELKRILQYQAKNHLVQQDVFEDIECEEDDEDS